MKALDLYKDYLKHLDKYTDSYTKFKEVSINELADLDFIVNNHIYVNGLKKVKTYVMIRSYNCVKYIDGSIDNANNEYSVFYTDIDIFNHKCTVLIKNSNNYFTWVIYNDDLFFKRSSSLNELKQFIKWLDVDELTNKVNEASDYIATALLLIDNSNVLINGCLDRYKDILTKVNETNQFQSEIHDYSIVSQHFREVNKYDELFFYEEGKLRRKGFINYTTDKYIISDVSLGELNFSLFYFSIDKDRSLLMFNASMFNDIIILFFKNGRASYVMDVNTLLEICGLFTLINREDIFAFLQQMNLFKDNTWKQFIV